MPRMIDPTTLDALKNAEDADAHLMGKRQWAPHFMVIAFVGVFVALRAYEADSTTILSAMIAIGSLGLAHVIVGVSTSIFLLLMDLRKAAWTSDHEPPPDG